MKLQQRIASFLLCLVIMITGLVGYVPGYATETLTNGNLSMANSQIESETLADSTIVDSNIVVGGTAQVGSEKIQLPDIVKEEINASQFIGRSPAKETNLNTFVFKNQDGTQTMKVYSHPVKYIDDKGKVQDISTDIKLNDNGSFETKANSIKTVFSKELKDGITLQANNVNIRLVSDKVTDGKLSDDNKTVTYKYDDKTDIEYSLTYTGFKEDIVVKEYTGQTEYEFTLYTNGLTLVKENGSYFLKDSNGKVQATIGDIIIFTADEKNNAFGNMTHETVNPNQEYVMTIHVDSEYLKDEKTKYPIRIDPTIEINYDDSGAGAIEDVTISQGTTYGGTSGSLYIGRNADGTLSRALMRFPTLNLTGISASQITNAYVELRDLMCQGDEPMIIECRPYLNSAPSWSEAQTVTWNSVGTNYYGAVFDSHEVLYGQGNAPDSGSIHRYRFDLTSLVRNWANGTQSAAKGIVLKATDTFEAQTGSNIQYWKKTFASYNRSANKPIFTLEYNPVLSIVQETVSVSENETVSLTASGTTGMNIIWEVNDEEFATVDSNGVVTGIKAGVTTIEASIRTDEGDIIDSDTCTVYVIIENGVYYIQNNNSDYYLHAKDGLIEECTEIVQSEKYGGSALDKHKVRQQWKIYYLGDGYYSIRPMHNLNMMLESIDGNVDIDTINGTDTMSSIPSYAKWTIKYNIDGYIIRNVEWEGYAMRIYNNSEENYASVDLMPLTSSTSYEWTLYKISNPPSGVLLYDMNSYNLAVAEVRYVAPGETITLNDLDIFATAYSGSSISQSGIRWSSSNTSIATVNSTTGAVTGKAPGSVTITVSAYSKSMTYTIIVTEISNGLYYIANRQNKYYADIKNQIMANGTIIHQWKFHSGKTQQWEFRHEGYGYYSIRSVKEESFYLSVKNNTSTLNEDIVLRTGAITTGMLWKIESTEQGAYRLIPKSGESNNYTLATSSSQRTNGAELMQGAYIDNNSYCDEWYVIKPDSMAPDAYLIGFLDTEDPDHDHVSVFGDVMPALNKLGCTYLKLGIDDNVYNIIDGDFKEIWVNGEEKVKTLLAQAQVFVYRGHGGRLNDTTALILAQPSDGEPRLTGYDIYDFDDSEAKIDMQHCDVALFVTCESYLNTGESLVHAAVYAGAYAAVGFSTIITCEGANAFTRAFFEHYSGGEDAITAAYDAEEEVVLNPGMDNSGIDSCKVFFLD